MKGDWRKDLERALRQGEWLEKLARHFKLDDLPFDVTAWLPSLDWTEGRIDLQTLEDRVKMMTRILDTSPTKTEANGNFGAVIKVEWRIELSSTLWLAQPDLKYQPRYLKTLTVKVEGWQMKGCQLVHKGERVRTTQKHELHTECVQVIQNWEDLDPALLKDKEPTPTQEASDV